MIKASELRAGVSIVYRIQTDLDSGKQIPVLVTVTANEIKEIEGRPEKHSYVSVTLATEWMFRFGFDKEFHRIGARVIYEHAKYPALKAEMCAYNVMAIYFNNELLALKNFVHEVQNLVFALTGQELELKAIEQKEKI